MRELAISDQELSELAAIVARLATDHWAGVDARPAYPQTSGAATTRLFSRAWPEEGLGRGARRFTAIADHHGHRAESSSATCSAPASR